MRASLIHNTKEPSPEEYDVLAKAKLLMKMHDLYGSVYCRAGMGLLKPFVINCRRYPKSVIHRKLYYYASAQGLLRGLERIIKRECW